VSNATPRPIYRWGKVPYPLYVGQGGPDCAIQTPRHKKICTSQITTPSLFILFQLSKLTTDVSENDTKIILILKL